MESSSDGYRYEETYFGDIVDALNLNPLQVKRILIKYGETTTGCFPNKHSRNGKEQVDYEAFYEELINSCCGANLLTYLATIDLNQLYAADFNLSQVIIPKGNTCGLYSSTQGGGSLLEMELKKDVKINFFKKHYPYFNLEIDKYNNYSIKDTYGVYDSFFGDPLTIV